MLLAVDVGNSNITLGAFERERLVATFRMTTNLPRTSDEYGTEIRGLLANNGISPNAIDSAIFSSVVPESRPLWHTYIMEHIDADDMAVLKALLPDGSIAGFCVLEDSEDGGDHFGVLCDILVNPDIRGRGIGSALLDAALGWFASRGLKDVYLESGKDNHPAHEFFMSKGFFKVSEVYARIGQ